MCVCTRMQDPSAVQDKGPAKSITVEDSFKDCSSLPAAQHVIKVLAPDLLARMVEDYQVRPWQRHMYFACRRCQRALVNLPAGVLIRSREWLVFVLFDLRSPVALCEKNCCTVRSAIFLHADDVKKGLVSLLACVLLARVWNKHIRTGLMCNLGVQIFEFVHRRLGGMQAHLSSNGGTGVLAGAGRLLPAPCQYPCSIPSWITHPKSACWGRH